jgi:hypothetical protein
MVSIRQRFELYVALRRFLSVETAAYLMEHFEDIERDPVLQHHNHERFASNRAAIYNLYDAMRSRIGETHVRTLFEMLDPLGWGDRGVAASRTVAAAETGSDHGCR